MGTLSWEMAHKGTLFRLLDGATPVRWVVVDKRSPDGWMMWGANMCDVDTPPGATFEEVQALAILDYRMGG